MVPILIQAQVKKQNGKLAELLRFRRPRTMATAPFSLFSVKKLADLSVAHPLYLRPFFAGRGTDRCCATSRADTAATDLEATCQPATPWGATEGNHDARRIQALAYGIRRKDQQRAARAVLSS
ncbi:uncharacterized protein PG998_011337 [Apiospora kogelbergensis]|uniref:Uncharacterized protein n=1 Tax=Apiospora kogelbergensis TaxID=1337665 RepID=A0AAW0RC50_9PEZI